MKQNGNRSGGEAALRHGLTIIPAVIGPVYIPKQAAGFVRRDVRRLIIDKEQQQALKGPSYTLDISHAEYRS